MSLTTHDLVDEFPAAAVLIAELRQADPEFAQIADRYDAADREILRIESGEEGASDERWEDLKKERLRLKDAIFAHIRVAAKR